MVIEESTKAIQARALQICAKVDNGTIDLLSACRWYLMMSEHLPPLPANSYNLFRGVESELDDVPDDRTAVHWEESALQQKMIERDEYLALVESRLRNAFVLLRCLIIDAQFGP